MATRVASGGGESKRREGRKKKTERDWRATCIRARALIRLYARLFAYSLAQHRRAPRCRRRRRCRRCRRHGFCAPRSRQAMALLLRESHMPQKIMQIYIRIWLHRSGIDSVANKLRSSILQSKYYNNNKKPNLHCAIKTNTSLSSSNRIGSWSRRRLCSPNLHSRKR